MSDRSDRSIAAWLALFLFGIYLLTYSGQIHSGDGMSMFSVAESFVKRGEFNTDQLWTLFKSRNEIAADDESYAKYGYGTSLFAAPLYALALVLPGVGLVQTTVLTSAIAIALILNDDARTLFFLNENRATIRWYGLSRDPKQFDDATRALLTRLSRQYSRVWFVFDDANAQLPNPMRAWLDQSLRPIAQRDFDDGAHLILFATDMQK